MSINFDYLYSFYSLVKAYILNAQKNCLLKMAHLSTQIINLLLASDSDNFVCSIACSLLRSYNVYLKYGKIIQEHV